MAQPWLQGLRGEAASLLGLAFGFTVNIAGTPLRATQAATHLRWQMALSIQQTADPDFAGCLCCFESITNVKSPVSNGTASCLFDLW